MATNSPFGNRPLITLEQHAEGCRVAVWSAPGIWHRTESDVDFPTIEAAMQLAREWAGNTDGALCFYPNWPAPNG